MLSHYLLVSYSFDVPPQALHGSDSMGTARSLFTNNPITGLINYPFRS